MSTIKTNTLTGTTSAGSIVVTGEGGSTTTNLQQGLAKVWSNFTTLTTFATNDTFNVSSMTDTSTGVSDGNFTNNMSNANYSGTASGERPALLIACMSTVANPATDHLTIGNAVGNDNSALDCDHVYFSVHGDLA